MIRKLVSIKSVGLFRGTGFHAVPLDTFSVIYGENGRGKTTLSAIVRSLKTGDPTDILERKTLGADSPPSIEVLLEKSTAIFVNGKWNASLPDLEVFDSHFVAKNVYSGSYVEHDHRRNLHQFVVGENGVQRALKVEELDTDARTCASDLSAEGDEIRKHLPGARSVDAFVDLSPVPDVDGQLSKKSAEESALQRAEEIGAKSLLSKLVIPCVDLLKVDELLGKRIETISSEAEAKTREHIASLHSGDGEDWLAQGYQLQKGNRCPFCGQPLSESDIFGAYQSYFGTSYANLKDDTYALRDDVEHSFSPSAMLAIQKGISDNDSLREFWREHVEAEFPEISAEDSIKCCNDLRGEILESLNAKASSLLEPVQLSRDAKRAYDRYQSMTAAVSDYNACVEKVNVLIEKRKVTSASGDLSIVRAELRDLKEAKLRFSTDVACLCDQYKALRDEKRCLDRAKREAKKKLDEYTTALLSQYEKGINDHLERSGAGFRVTGTKTSYAGGRPSATYGLLIEENKVDLGDSKTISQTPCFRNTLSEGDKSSLAFAFFLTKLDHDANLAQRIVVFDDPISSLDASRRTFTRQQIIRISNKCRQTIVLTHDAYFAREIWEDVRSKGRFYQIVRRDDGSIIIEWDVESATRGEYFKNYFALHEYQKGGPKSDADLRAVARCIRPLLEGNLRMRFPEEFDTNEWLGQFISKVRESTRGQPLWSLAARLDDISDLNGYSAKYHHDQNPSADSETVTDGELKTYVARTLKLIGGILSS